MIGTGVTRSPRREERQGQMGDDTRVLKFDGPQFVASYGSTGAGIANKYKQDPQSKPQELHDDGGQGSMDWKWDMLIKNR